MRLVSHSLATPTIDIYNPVRCIMSFSTNWIPGGFPAIISTVTAVFVGNSNKHCLILQKVDTIFIRL